jgi:hypothetical protein
MTTRKWWSKKIFYLFYFFPFRFLEVFLKFFTYCVLCCCFLLSHVQKLKVGFCVLQVHVVRGLFCYLSFFHYFVFPCVGCIKIFIWKLNKHVATMQIWSTTLIHSLLLFIKMDHQHEVFCCLVYHHNHWTTTFVFLQTSSLISYTSRNNL